MRNRLAEISILIVSVLKWFVLASLVGVLVGGSTALFLWCLQGTTNTFHAVPYHYILLPFALFLSALIVQYLAPDAKGHGTEKVIEAFHQRGGLIQPLVVPVKLLATVITLASGGSAGKEGPCAQIGAGLSSTLAGMFGFDELDRKKLVICGVSAGFSTVFGTPIAGALFGVEVLAIVSFLIVGRRSVYPSQIQAITKSPSIHPRLGKTIVQAETTIPPARRRGVVRAGKKAFSHIRKKRKK